MTVRLDIIDDAQVAQDASGITVTRRAIIRGITGPSDQRQRRALEAPGLPRFGDRHPAWSELRLADIRLAPIDAESWDVRLTYRDPTPGELVDMVPPGTVVDRTWFAVTITEELVQDIDGERLYQFYRGNPLTPTIISTGGIQTGFRFIRTFNQTIWKNEKAEVQKPSVGVRITISDTSPLERLLPFAGTINQGRWSGYNAETWLVGGMDSRREAENRRWINTIELFYRPETWAFKSVVEWFGAPPDDASVGNGIHFFDVYRKVNFSGLGFTL